MAVHAIPGTKQADLTFDTKPDTYAVLYTINLCNRQEIARFRGAANVATNVTVSTDNAVGFWKVSSLIPIE